MSLGKIKSKSGPLQVMVKPSDPPKGSGEASGGRSGHSRGPGLFSPRSNYSHSSGGDGGGGRSIDDDISMDEDPSQIIKVNSEVLFRGRGPLGYHDHEIFSHFVACV